ncbi:MAG TPA: phospho-sugar mutase [Polyangiaceae bacterium]|nr:phospho-sugar mutase [Polyangiaceae bacterium]
MAVDLAELRARVERWIEEDPDPVTQAELRALLASSDVASTDLADRFDGALEFGTAGLRGVVGAGPNRMNRAVVARATWGLAQELLASVPQAAKRGVVVGCDARRMSDEFADDTASVLAAAGLRVVRFARPVPTPVVSFAVRHLGAAAGVVITASHNPREYNGYKVYWENSAQIIPPVDGRIAAAIRRAPPARAVDAMPAGAARAAGLLGEAGAEVERAYLEAVERLAVHPSEGRRGLRIVYTPLHGVGDAFARAALSRAGFAEVSSVPQQREPDGAFPTVAFPNPEEPGTMDCAFDHARRTSADLVLANDPDADRLAVAIRKGDTYRQLTGNEVGVLLGHYLLTEGRATRPRAVVVSLVSSPWLGRIAAELGAKYEETLTGFKWIANRAIELEREGYDFVFGYEEALGYCVGSAVRDKDGISAALLMAELAAVLDARGMNLDDRLDAIARQWGYFTSGQVNVVRKGAEGARAIRTMMAELRAAEGTASVDRLGGAAVVAIADYEAGRRAEVGTGRSAPLSLPRSDVLRWDLEGGARVIVRPSGTEPKVKIYLDVGEVVAPGESVDAAKKRAHGRMAALEQDVRARFEGPA